MYYGQRPVSMVSRRLSRRLSREVDRWTEYLRESLALRDEQRLLIQARERGDMDWRDPNPLVTVRIATHDRGPLIAERAIASVQAQTYDRLEILVIGDRCDSATEKAVLSIEDPRLKFVNLPTQGLYPSYRAYRRKVAGAHAMNAGLYLARGKWIAPCDDDDELTADHVEILLRHALAERLEMVYSKALHEVTPGEWRIVGDQRLRMGAISHGSVLYSSGLRFMRHSETCWKLKGEPSDWNLWKRMKAIGVRFGFLDRVTYRHYLGAYQRDEIACNVQL